MDSNYISEPVEFRQLEGKAIDFRKTFDLRGRGVDEMLQLYLRKAHLNDDIERLPAEQRRTYVHDIIRSNKSPGYWVPPLMQGNRSASSNDVFAHPPPAVRPPPVRASPITERRGYADNASLSMSHSSSSSNSLQSYNGAAPAVSSYSTNVLVSSKGSKYEISGPTNFQHVAGDVTRDRTRNAFDLSATSNDNVLKKYMMEHGIADEDISELRRQEVIKRIVHSKFTWVPTKQDLLAKPKTPTIVYATISSNNQITPPQSPLPAMKRQREPASAFANYASLTSRFVDLSEMPMPTPQQHEVGTVVPVQVQSQQQPNRQKIPPPPSTITARNTRPVQQPQPVAETRPANVPQETYATIAPQRKAAGTMRVPPPAAPKPTIVPNKMRAAPPPPPAKNMPATQYTPAPAALAPKQPKAKIVTAAIPPPPPPPPPAPMVAVGVPIPPPPPPPMSAMGGPMPPPPPPPMAAATPMKMPAPAKAAAAGGDNRDAFLESIRLGVSLKKVDQKAATISGVKPRAERKPATTDFLSELKLGITLRRVKNPADNPYSDANADESQA